MKNKLTNNGSTNNRKYSLAIFSLTCCEGCQFEILKHYEDFAKLLNFYDIKNFRLGQEDNFPGPYDVALVEGTPESENEVENLKNIRAESKIVVAIGSCAHLGGIQSERNQLPKKLISKENVKSVPDLIKVDYIVPGCPISHKELYKCLLDIYHNKIFTLPDYSVCFECRQNENECLLKKGKLCLGPITRGGCNSICVNGGEACLGCRGPLDQANFPKIKEMLEQQVGKNEINDLLTIYGDLEKYHRKYLSQNR